MKSSSTITNVYAFIITSFALIADAVLEANTDPEINEQLAELIKTFGPDSDVVKPLAAVKAAKDNEAREELIRLLTESGEKEMPLMRLEKDHVCFLAGKFGVTNRDLGDWRQRRVLEMASEDLITDEQIKSEVFVEDAALDQLVAKLVKAGKIVRDGAGYRVPELVTKS